MLRFEREDGLSYLLGTDAYYAEYNKNGKHYSFIIIRVYEDRTKFESSWQDQIKGGSASSTRERHSSLPKAESHLRNVLKNLLVRN